jgi:hypothetical protein
MVSVILDIMTSKYMDILIQSGMEVFLIERTLQDVVSIWVSHDLKEEQEAIQYFSQHDRSGIHCNMLH